MKRVFLLLELLYVTTLLLSFTLCDATKSRISQSKRLNLLRLISNNVGSPFSLPPFEPISSPPYCTDPPPPPTPVTVTTPIGGGGGVNTPDSPYIPPFLPLPSPPPTSMGSVPSPTGFIPTPSYSFPSPPLYIPGPPGPTLISPPSPPLYIPGPPGPTLMPPPSPPTSPVFEPPVVYPPPTGPPPPKRGSGMLLWCVAKPSVPDPIIEEAMNYACGSGADCGSILPSGSCYEPDTLFAHASYAFNSYWQRTKVAGGTCEFGGTAMLVTVDPSYDGCHFLYY